MKIKFENCAEELQVLNVEMGRTVRNYYKACSIRILVM